jgi:hypothetical protein
MAHLENQLEIHLFLYILVVFLVLIGKQASSSLMHVSCFYDCSCLIRHVIFIEFNAYFAQCWWGFGVSKHVQGIWEQ